MIMAPIRTGLAQEFAPKLETKLLPAPAHTAEIISLFPQKKGDLNGPFLSASQRQFVAQMGEVRRLEELRKRHHPVSETYRIQSQPFWPNGYEV